MSNNYALINLQDFDLRVAAIAPELQTALFSCSALAAFGLIAFLLYRRYPAFWTGLADRFQRLIFPTQQRREARLERVVCYHCKKGMGLYDPIYVTYQGEPHVEGICSCCGQFVRARLR